MTAPSMPGPAPIPVSPDFPITWDSPELATLPFQQDRQHSPNPMTPLSAWFAQNGFSVGASRALASYDVPMAFTVGHFNYYYYMAIAPTVPPEAMAEYEPRIQAKLMPAVMQFRARWEQEWLPELQRTWDDWAKFDLGSASLPRLLERLDECQAVFQRIWQIHFELLVPAFVGFSEFRGLYGQIFPDAGDLAAYRLLQGFDNKSLEADRAFWALSRQVAAAPALKALFESTPVDEIGAALPVTAGGPEFLEAMAPVLDRWGRRSDTVQEMADPSWLENPRPLFLAIRAFLERGEDPQHQHEEMVAAREAAVAEARQKLAGQPPELAGQFEALLFAAQSCSFLQEDHNHWIDQRGLHEVRQVCLAVGQRLAEVGKLASVDDVFLFSLPELKELAAGTASGTETARTRRAEMQRWAAVTPPPMVGTDYGPPPDNPITRAIGRMFGAPPPASDETVIRGNPGSSGKIRGIARVINTIDDADRLGVGEILVAPTTSPPWTPLFGIASAVVTDTGGPLSHCAVVCREYGIPGVVGTKVGTARIRDGQTIEVDGDAGTVQLY